MIYVMSDIHGMYDKYIEMLELINLREHDSLYILGDIVDRGLHPMKILQDMMKRPNVFGIFGNHELMMAECFNIITQEITNELLDNFDEEALIKLSDWMNNGAFQTIQELKKLSEEERKHLISECQMKPNSVLFFIANRNLKLALKYASLIRIYLGEKCNLIDKNKLELCIVKDFPMFEYDEEKKKIDFCHNPFSLPHHGIKDYEQKDVLDILAYQYDFVCNGFEMASGAIRNHDLESLVKGFEIVSYTKEEVKEKFNSIYTAFQYGCPPHGGMAPGIDRILMLLLDEPNLREVQAFPTSTTGMDNLMGSPSSLTETQLKELGIRVREEKKNE